ncbi:MAG: hypothetical protein DI606_13920 [Sphingobium sp.]|uniref:hypothetical protein n=1 Tax=Sphingobium sp. TaxID=1912891 RepID=UPI000DB71D5A|nr:hypothetical protein [Sphingobium sp.]PZU09393.1 MAG: hypothetical protein DI606_13920 [Sphingobium sp.]
MPLTKWIQIGTTLAAAMVIGVGLGSFVTSPPRGAADERDDLARYAASIATPADDMAMRGPVEVKCTGCGPTLEERHWQVETGVPDAEARASDSAERIVGDYYARLPADETPVVEATAKIAPHIDPLPDNIARFARGDGAGLAPQSTPYTIKVEAPPSPGRTATLQ